MDNILERLNCIERKLDELAALKRKLDELAVIHKETLNFKEAARYLDISRSHLYKLTYSKQIPHYKPRGKQVYFERRELDKWLLQNRQTTKAEIEQAANDYVVMKGGKR